MTKKEKYKVIIPEAHSGGVDGSMKVVYSYKGVQYCKPISYLWENIKQDFEPNFGDDLCEIDCVIQPPKDTLKVFDPEIGYAHVMAIVRSSSSSWMDIKFGRYPYEYSAFVTPNQRLFISKPIGVFDFAAINVSIGDRAECFDIRITERKHPKAIKSIGIANMLFHKRDNLRFAYNLITDIGRFYANGIGLKSCEFTRK